MITGISHPKMFDRINKSTLLVSDNELVGQYLRILILSSVGEFLADPNYGCSLSSLLYSPNDSILIDQVKDSIVEAIRTYASSIVVEFNDIEITQDELSMYIKIKYRLSDKSETSVLDLTILNSEVSNV